MMKGHDNQTSTPLEPVKHRRQLVASEASSTAQATRSFSLEQALLENLTLHEQLESEFKQADSPASYLGHMLSQKSVISTTSSFANKQAQAQSEQPDFREIGTGSVGKVFEHPGTLYAYKLPLGNQHDKLWNNYVMHARVKHSFDQFTAMNHQAEIPRCFWYAMPDTKSFWDKNLARFPASASIAQRPGHVLCMERVFPLPRPIRQALVEQFCPPGLRERVSASETDKDCLIRPYLGRIRHGKGQGLFFSLRNFKLHADQIKTIGLDVEEMIISMAQAMAILHWHTRIDANDVEFVIGSSPLELQKDCVPIDPTLLRGLTAPTSTYDRVTQANADFHKRVTSLWILDFDDCHDITMDSNGVEKAITAFVFTNHYCPRPSRDNDFIQGCWNMFAPKYISFSNAIFDKQGLPTLKPLAQQFVQGLENHYLKLDRSKARGSRQSSDTWSFAPSQASVRREQGTSRAARIRSESSWRRGTQSGGSESEQGK